MARWMQRKSPTTLSGSSFFWGGDRRRHSAKHSHCRNKFANQTCIVTMRNCDEIYHRRGVQTKIKNCAAKAALLATCCIAVSPRACTSEDTAELARYTR